jgi:predicted nucleotidyltransferase component of viral defense system
MIDKAFLAQQATKNQTTLKNVSREYVQHLYLSNFYQLKKSEHFFFKGGTALRLVFRSPRFSEDIDFTASSNSGLFEDLFQDTLTRIEQEGLRIDLEESKQTTGGHLAIINVAVYNEPITIKIEASQRKKKTIQGEKSSVVSDMFPSYTVQILDQQTLVSEKIEAFLTRHKIRDFFDLYYILRARLGTKSVAEKKNEILKTIATTKQDFKDLKQFLPKNFWPIAEDLKRNLMSELKRL